MRALDDHGGILLAAVALGAGAMLGAAVAGARRARAAEVVMPEVTPSEDLMREHGVLRRLLLIYDDVAGRLERGQPAPLELLARAAGLVRTFVEDYHEELEERFVFPPFEKAGILLDLVKVLDTQHHAGRMLTGSIVQRAKSGVGVRELPGALRAFARMYRPHAAFEDTVLFPRLREVVGARAYAEMGEQFEDLERARFGKQGFENVVAEVARIEEKLGIHDLARFTPR